ncbi:DNA polymerase IV [Paraoerskovia sediminicola]|uniref:DNA polymerase IV n=1 Tax=Paraoerskovia sediminicola TaxID=1138587 RepID=A0ABM8G6R1_9CELL|nr:DNA polymerase IV [Paraoerskovia sediminicola]BDZ43853.1 DNA polymerase IV [Paraoerskovia sediminicola]
MSRGPRASSVRRSWGDDESGASVLHVDLDAFFASVEVARRPELRGRCVIVGGAGRGVVLAATYEARAFGVQSAMPMKIALRRCPTAVVVPPDHREYLRVSSAVLDLVRGITPIVEQVSVDEAYLDVSGARRRLGAPSAIAAGLRAQVEREHGITCSVGIGASKLVAKLASTHAKPNGVLLVPSDRSVAFLRELPVGALSGVGERTGAALARWGITTVAQLADEDVAVVQAAVGKVHGAHLHDLAHGRDPRPVVATRTERSIGAERTFSSDLRDAAVIGRELLLLADRCAGRLRSHGLLARTVSVKVRTSDFRTVTRSRTLDPATDVAADLHRVARELVAGVDRGGLAVRLVGVRAESLLPRATAVVQPTLAESLDARTGSRRDVESAVDDVRRRFGAGSVALGAGRGSPTTTRSSNGLS